MISFLIVVCIVSCQVLEVYAYFIKGTTSNIYNRQLVGLANWIQYVARINYVFVLFLISYTFEVLNMGTTALKLISLSFFLAFTVSFLMILNIKARLLVKKLIFPLVYFSYRELIDFSVNFQVHNVKPSKPMWISLLSSTLLGLAFILPFILASKFPEYRMMATYSGQFLNFLASAIIFSMLEPIMYKELDKEKNNGIVCQSASSIILAKLISQALISIFVFMVI